MKKEVGKKLKVLPGIEYYLSRSEITINITSRKKLIDGLHRSQNSKGLQNTGQIILLRIHDLILEQAADTEDQMQITVTYDEIFYDTDYYYALLENLKLSPYLVKFFSRGLLNKPDFSLDYTFIQGGLECNVDVFGPVVYSYTSDVFYKLKPSVFRAIWLIERKRSAVDFFGMVSDERVLLRDVLKEINFSSEDIELEDYLKAFDIVVPKNLSIALKIEGENAVSLYPKLDGVDENALMKRFSTSSEFGDVLVIEGTEKRSLVILDESMKEIFNSLAKKKTHVGEDFKKLMYDPYAVLGDGLDKTRILLDQSFFSDRVRGILKTSFKIFCTYPYDKSGIEWFGETSTNSIQHNTDEKKFYKFTVQSMYDGEYYQIQLDESQLNELHELVQTAINLGRDTVEFQDHHFAVMDVIDLLNKSQTKCSKRKGEREIFKMDVVSNEESVEYGKETFTQSEVDTNSAQIAELESILNTDIKLMEHQKDGILWLLRNFSRRDTVSGCLLADEMGLGKTFQALGFLALALKHYREEFFNLDHDLWNPILIIANTVLFQNWLNEIEHLFRENLFTPLIVLHGKELKSFRIDKGREIIAGRELLNKTKIRKYLCVITNFDTLVNYQLSLCQIKWSVVIVDEAHNVNSKSLRSEAIKALKAGFKVFLTGTPVENKIEDLWELFDSLIPGLLKSRQEFMKVYGQLNKPDEAPAGLMESLRQIFKINDLKAGLILRREKNRYQSDSEVSLGLPPKKDVVEHIRIDPIILEAERRISERVQARVEDALMALHKLQLLYTCKGLAIREFNELCDLAHDAKNDLKLQRLLDILAEIKTRNEKVVIFVRHFKIIDVLKQAIMEKFRSVNPKVLHTRESGGTDLDRKIRVLESFQKSEGFDILFLSPILGAEGLNLQEANHVVHYERWWNPAKERQATDRVHRIGQRKNVFVYYLLYTYGDASSRKTFDEKLDLLITNKIKLSHDFLKPSVSEENLRKELNHLYFES